MNSRDDRQTLAMDPAYKFIRCCLLLRHDQEQIAEVRAMKDAAAFTWDDVARMAALHRVQELLFDSVRGREIFPQSLEAKLADAFRLTTMRNLPLIHEVGLETAHLSSLGYDVMALKGASLLGSVYPFVGLRPMVDIDLLVRKSQLQGVLSGLLSHGFVQDVETRPGAAIEFENEITLRRQGFSEFRIDLHWSLFDSIFYQNHLSLDWFWATAQRGRIVGAEYRIPGPEAQLLHLCGHAALHHSRFPNLLWLNDLVEVVGRYRATIDWELLVKRAQEMALGLAARRYLGLIAREWSAAVPEEAVRLLETIPVSHVEQIAYERHAAKREKSLSSRIMPDLLELPSTKGRLRFLWGKLVPSSTYLISRYRLSHAALLPFAYSYHITVGLAATVVALAMGATNWVRRQLGTVRRQDEVAS